MKPIKFHPQAECEFAESVDFYNGRISGLGDDFFMTVKLAGHQIQSDPLRRLLRRDGTRRVKLPRFPYAVVYRDQPDQIEIVAVAHGARRPGYWRDRL
jgi:toxin ParE1/3/4